MLNRLKNPIDTTQFITYAAGPLAALVVFVLYGLTTVSLFGVWFNNNNPTYNHGPLLLLVAFALFFRNIRLGRVRLSASSTTLPVLTAVAAGLVWLAAALVQVQVIEYVALVILVTAAVSFFYGGPRSSGVILPLAALLFALPFWEMFTEPLRQFTVLGTRLLIAVSALPAYVEGHLLHTGGGVFSVEPECSGLRQFIVAGAMGLIMGEYWLLSARRRAVLCVAAVCVGVVSNIIRVFLIVLIGIHTSMDNPLVTSHHSTLGWIVFAFMFTAFVFIAARYAPMSDNRPAAGWGESVDIGSTLKRAGLMLAAVAIAPLLWGIFSVKASGAEPRLEALPARISDWIRTDEAARRWPAVDLGADAVVTARYERKTDPGQSVDVHIHQFVRQHHGKEAVQYGNRLYDARLWTSVGESRYAVDGGPEVVELVLRSGTGRTRLVWYWFEAAGRSTAGPVGAKLFQAWGAITGRYQVDIVALSTPASTQEEARERLTGFVRHVIEASAW